MSRKRAPQPTDIQGDAMSSAFNYDEAFSRNLGWFTEAEQRFYASKGFESAPVRCSECRKGNKIKKEERIEARAKKEAEGNVRYNKYNQPASWGAVAQQAKAAMGITQVPKARVNEFEKSKRTTYTEMPLKL